MWPLVLCSDNHGKPEGGKVASTYVSSFGGDLLVDRLARPVVNLAPGVLYFR